MAAIAASLLGGAIVPVIEKLFGADGEFDSTQQLAYTPGGVVHPDDVSRQLLQSASTHAPPTNGTNNYQRGPMQTGQQYHAAAIGNRPMITAPGVTTMRRHDDDNNVSTIFYETFDMREAMSHHVEGRLSADAFPDPLSFYKYAHPKPDGTGVDYDDALDRGYSGTRWETNGNNGFAGCGMFPAVMLDGPNKEASVRPYFIGYASFQPSDASILHVGRFQEFAAEWEPGAFVYIDVALLGDMDTKKSLVSAINLCKPLTGSYIWIMPADVISNDAHYDVVAFNKMKSNGFIPGDGNPATLGADFMYGRVGTYYQLGGASLGMGAIAAFLNMPRVCYTGFVRRLVPDMSTRRQLKMGANQAIPMNAANDAEARDVVQGAVAPQYAPQFNRLSGVTKIPHMGDDAAKQNWYGTTQLVKIAKGTDIVEEVDMLSYKCAWAIATNYPLVIPHVSNMDEPLEEVLRSKKFQGKHYLLSLAPNAYSMVQAEGGLRYADSGTPILIASTVTGAYMLGGYAWQYYGLGQHEGRPKKIENDLPQQRQVLDWDHDAIFDNNDRRGVPFPKKDRDLLRRSSMREVDIDPVTNAPLPKSLRQPARYKTQVPDGRGGYKRSGYKGTGRPPDGFVHNVGVARERKKLPVPKPHKGYIGGAHPRIGPRPPPPPEPQPDDEDRQRDRSDDRYPQQESPSRSMVRNNRSQDRRSPRREGSGSRHNARKKARTAYQIPPATRTLRPSTVNSTVDITKPLPDDFKGVPAKAGGRFRQQHSSSRRHHSRSSSSRRSRSGHSRHRDELDIIPTKTIIALYDKHRSVSQSPDRRRKTRHYSSAGSHGSKKNKKSSSSSRNKKSKKSSHSSPRHHRRNRSSSSSIRNRSPRRVLRQRQAKRRKMGIDDNPKHYSDGESSSFVTTTDGGTEKTYVTTAKNSEVPDLVLPSIDVSKLPMPSDMMDKSITDKVHVEEGVPHLEASQQPSLSAVDTDKSLLERYGNYIGEGKTDPSSSAVESSVAKVPEKKSFWNRYKKYLLPALIGGGVAAVGIAGARNVDTLKRHSSSITKYLRKPEDIIPEELVEIEPLVEMTDMGPRGPVIPMNDYSSMSEAGESPEAKPPKEVKTAKENKKDRKEQNRSGSKKQGRPKGTSIPPVGQWDLRPTSLEFSGKTAGSAGRFGTPTAPEHRVLLQFRMEPQDEMSANLLHGLMYYGSNAVKTEVSKLHNLLCKLEVYDRGMKADPSIRKERDHVAVLKDRMIDALVKTPIFQKVVNAMEVNTKIHHTKMAAAASKFNYQKKKRTQSTSSSRHRKHPKGQNRSKSRRTNSRQGRTAAPRTTEQKSLQSLVQPEAVVDVPHEAVEENHPNTDDVVSAVSTLPTESSVVDQKVEDGTTTAVSTAVSEPTVVPETPPVIVQDAIQQEAVNNSVKVATKEGWGGWLKRNWKRILVGGIAVGVATAVANKTANRYRGAPDLELTKLRGDTVDGIYRPITVPRSRLDKLKHTIGMPMSTEEDYFVGNRLDDAVEATKRTTKEMKDIVRVLEKAQARFVISQVKEANQIGKRLVDMHIGMASKEDQSGLTNPTVDFEVNSMDIKQYEIDNRIQTFNEFLANEQSFESTIHTISKEMENERKQITAIPEEMDTAKRRLRDYMLDKTEALQYKSQEVAAEVANTIAEIPFRIKADILKTSLGYHEQIMKGISMVHISSDDIKSTIDTLDKDLKTYENEIAQLRALQRRSEKGEMTNEIMKDIFENYYSMTLMRTVIISDLAAFDTLEPDMERYQGRIIHLKTLCSKVINDMTGLSYDYLARTKKINEALRSGTATTSDMTEYNKEALGLYPDWEENIKRTVKEMEKETEDAIKVLDKKCKTEETRAHQRVQDNDTKHRIDNTVMQDIVSTNIAHLNRARSTSMPSSGTPALSGARFDKKRHTKKSKSPAANTRRRGRSTTPRSTSTRSRSASTARRRQYTTNQQKEKLSSLTEKMEPVITSVTNNVIPTIQPPPTDPSPLHEVPVPQPPEEIVDTVKSVPMSLGLIPTEVLVEQAEKPIEPVVTSTEPSKTEPEVFDIVALPPPKQVNSNKWRSIFKKAALALGVGTIIGISGYRAYKRTRPPVYGTTPRVVPEGDEEAEIDISLGDTKDDPIHIVADAMVSRAVNHVRSAFELDYTPGDTTLTSGLKFTYALLDELNKTIDSVENATELLCRFAGIPDYSATLPFVTVTSGLSLAKLLTGKLIKLSAASATEVKKLYAIGDMIARDMGAKKISWEKDVESLDDAGLRKFLADELHDIEKRVLVKTEVINRRSESHPQAGGFFDDVKNFVKNASVPDWVKLGLKSVAAAGIGAMTGNLIGKALPSFPSSSPQLTDMQYMGHGNPTAGVSGKFDRHEHETTHADAFWKSFGVGTIFKQPDTKKEAGKYWDKYFHGTTRYVPEDLERAKNAYINLVEDRKHKYLTTPVFREKHIFQGKTGPDYAHYNSISDWWYKSDEVFEQAIYDIQRTIKRLPTAAEKRHAQAGEEARARREWSKKIEQDEELHNLYKGQGEEAMMKEAVKKYGPDPYDAIIAARIGAPAFDAIVAARTGAQAGGRFHKSRKSSRSRSRTRGRSTTPRSNSQRSARARSDGIFSKIGDGIKGTWNAYVKTFNSVFDPLIGNPIDAAVDYIMKSKSTKSQQSEDSDTHKEFATQLDAMLKAKDPDIMRLLDPNINSSFMTYTFDMAENDYDDLRAKDDDPDSTPPVEHQRKLVKKALEMATKDPDKQLGYIILRLMKKEIARQYAWETYNFEIQSNADYFKASPEQIKQVVEQMWKQFIEPLKNDIPHWALGIADASPYNTMLMNVWHYIELKSDIGRSNMSDRRKGLDKYIEGIAHRIRNGLYKSREDPSRIENMIKSLVYNDMYQILPHLELIRHKRATGDWTGPAIEGAWKWNEEREQAAKFRTENASAGGSYDNNRRKSKRGRSRSSSRSGGRRNTHTSRRRGHRMAKADGFWDNVKSYAKKTKDWVTGGGGLNALKVAGGLGLAGLATYGANKYSGGRLATGLSKYASDTGSTISKYAGKAGTYALNRAGTVASGIDSAIFEKSAPLFGIIGTKVMMSPVLQSILTGVIDNTLEEVLDVKVNEKDPEVVAIRAAQAKVIENLIKDQSIIEAEKRKENDADEKSDKRRDAERRLKMGQLQAKIEAYKLKERAGGLTDRQKEAKDLAEEQLLEINAIPLARTSGRFNGKSQYGRHGRRSLTPMPVLKRPRHDGKRSRSKRRISISVSKYTESTARRGRKCSSSYALRHRDPTPIPGKRRRHH